MASYTLENTKFSVDWLNCRLEVKDLDAFFDDLCSSFVNSETGEHPLTRDMISVRGGGVCFYKCGYYIPACGYSSVVFAFNVDSNGVFESEPGFRKLYGLLVSVSGDGCRYLNSLLPDGMLKFCRILNKYNPHITRIDVACDFLDKNNAVVPLIQEYGRSAYDREFCIIDFNCNINRKPGFCKLDLVYDPDVGDFTTNVTVGNRSSEKGQMQLYNKKIEMQQGRLSDISAQTFSAYGVTDYWYRLEYRCKNFAGNVFSVLLENGIVQAYLYAASYFGNFVDTATSHSNISQCSVNSDWSDFKCWIESLAADIHFV